MSDKRTYAYLVGTRPNFIKMAPVVDAMRALRPLAKHLLIHTGQHYDDSMSRVFFEELGLPRPDFFLGVGSGSHGYQTAAALTRIESVLIETHADVLVVPGDVNSTLAGALAATKVGVSVIHLESGLRSRDRSMPEEINRIVADQIADLCLVHSWSAVENLAAEGIEGDRVRMVGNTMIDSLVRHLPSAEQSQIADHLGVEKGHYLLVTLHRPSLVESHDLALVVAVLEDLARRHPCDLSSASANARGTGPAGDWRTFDPYAAPALSRFSVSRSPCASGRYRLRRRTGGDDVSPSAVLDSARQHRAAGHRDVWDEPDNWKRTGRATRHLGATRERPAAGGATGRVGRLGRAACGGGNSRVQ